MEKNPPRLIILEMSLPNKIILIGAGGHARTVLDCLGNVAHGFCDDKTDVFSSLVKLEPESGSFAIISFGAVEPKGLARRQKVFEEYKAKGVIFKSAIHASAIVSGNALIGDGSMIGPGAIVNSGAVIGQNVIINSGAIIEHDVIIGDGSHVAPGAIVLGGAKIGKIAMIGAGAVILPSAEVDDGAMVRSMTRYPS